MKRSVLSISMEAAKYQTDATAFKALTEEFEKLQKIYETSSVFSREDFSPLMATVKEHFNIEAEYAPPYGRYTYDMAVLPPDIDANNPIAYDESRIYRDSAEGISHLRRNAGRIEGGVDDNGKVWGVFAKMRVYFCIGNAWFKESFEARHIAAIFLHEIGHYDSYIRALVETVTMSAALVAVAQEWSGANAQQRIVLISKAAEHTDSNISQIAKEQASRIDNIEGVASILVMSKIIDPRSAMGTSYMDYSQWEAASDQFAVRMGAGMALSEVLHLAHKTNPGLFLKNRYVYLVNIGNVLGALWGGVVGGILVSLKAVAAGATATLNIPVALTAGAVVAVMVYWFNGAIGGGSPFESSHDIYDHPVRRIERIFIEMRGELKNKSLPAAQTKIILRNLDDVKMMMSEYYSAVPLAYRFACLLSAPSHRSMRFREQQQRRLESLANNELFATAALVRNI